jgi:hypothetical protein
MFHSMFLSLKKRRWKKLYGNKMEYSTYGVIYYMYCKKSLKDFVFLSFVFTESKKRKISL